MSRIVFLSMFRSKVLDFLLFHQERYDVLLVDFSNGTDLENIAGKSRMGYRKFCDWMDLSNYMLEIDLIITYKLPVIVPGYIVRLAQYGAFNIHPSLLPHYRGLNPWFDMYYDGELCSGVTIHRISPTPDEGAVMLQYPLTIEFGEPWTVAMGKSEKIAVEMIREFLDSKIFLRPGKAQPEMEFKVSNRAIDSIRQLSVRRMWHLFRGFPSLLKTVFPELPHTDFEVGEFYEGKSSADAEISDDFTRIEIGDSFILLIDFSRQPMALDHLRCIKYR